MEQKMKQDLAKLSRAVYENRNFEVNGTSGEDAMRNMMYDALGLEEGVTGNELYYAYERNKTALFEIINVTVDALTPTIVRDEFNSLANFTTKGLNQNVVFTNPNTKLFKVSQIANGTQDLRRQNLVGSTYEVSTDYYGVAVYTEFEQFLTGMVNWSDFITRVSDSFASYIGQRIYQAFAEAYDKARSHLNATGTFDIETLINLAAHVKASAGVSEVTVYGSPSALGKVASQVTLLSDAMADEVNRLGYLTTFRGIRFMALPEVYVPGTNEFLVDDNSLTLVPTGSKIVDVVFEGDTFTREEQAPEHQALQMSFIMMRKLGIQVNQAAVYGVYQLNA